MMQSDPVDNKQQGQRDACLPDEAGETNQDLGERVGLTSISVADLSVIMEQHRLWMEHEGAQGQKCNLRHMDLRKFDLSRLDLRNADLSHADLSGADLSFTDLSGADLSRAKLNFSDLNGARLRQLILSETAFTAVRNLSQEALMEIDFCDDLQVTGLSGSEFSGLDLTGYALPSEVPIYDQLKVVENASKNARATFLTMISFCLYSWLTIGTTTDALLLANSATSPLPIIKTPVPIVWFYLLAPCILITTYVYFHFSMQRVWSAFSFLPVKFSDGMRVDQKAFPWLFTGLTRRYLNRDNRSLISHLEELGSLLVGWWIVPITLCLYWARYLPRQDWMGTTMHLLLMLVSLLLAMRFLLLSKKALGVSQVSRIWAIIPVHQGFVSWKEKWFGSSAFMVFGLFAIAIFVGMQDLKNIFEFHPVFVRSTAELWEKDVSSRSGDYWKRGKEHQLEVVRGANIDDVNLRHANASLAFFAKAKARHADFSFAQLDETDFRKADLSHAKFNGADLSNGIFIGAELLGAQLRQSKLNGADFTGVRLIGADLSGATLLGANLKGANLKNAILDRTSVGFANLSGVILDGASLKGANLASVFMLKQHQVDDACGDENTVLPGGLTIPLCDE